MKRFNITSKRIAANMLDVNVRKHGHSHNYGLGLAGPGLGGGVYHVG